MTAGEVIALMRLVFTGNVMLDVNQVEQLRRLLEAHEAQVREQCAQIAERDSDSPEAALIAAAIREECN